MAGITDVHFPPKVPERFRHLPEAPLTRADTDFRLEKIRLGLIRCLIQTNEGVGTCSCPRRLVRIEHDDRDVGRRAQGRLVSLKMSFALILLLAHPADEFSQQGVWNC